MIIKMNFAKQQLLKYGWTEGKGLGKKEDGIVDALKPMLKFDTTGIGHDYSEQFTYNWWENVFNVAADNINVIKSDNGEVNIELNSRDSVNITTKKYSSKFKSKKKKNLEYGSFLKTSKLIGAGEIEYEGNKTANEEVVPTFLKLTDEDLFAACGGRTAHKGARHGLKLNGKLSRIEQQEEMFLKMYNAQQNTSQTKRSNVAAIDDSENITNEQVNDENTAQTRRKTKCTDNDSSKTKKKRKRKREKSQDVENEIEIEAARKKYEHYCDKKYRKKLKIKRRREEKTFSAISEMFENCNLDKNEKSEDDGFDECVNKKKIKLTCEEGKDVPKKKKKRKKRCKNNDKHTAKCMDDAGFCELMNEISDRLVTSKELRKKLKEKQKRVDEDRICKISEDLNQLCTV